MRKPFTYKIKYVILCLLLVGTLGDICIKIDPTVIIETPEDTCPSWDTDCDDISNAVETNDANSYLNLDPDTPDDNPSIAHGYPCDGWIENALNMVNQGTGYYHYNPEKDETTIDTDDWGVLHLINMIEGAGRDWYDNIFYSVRIGVGDLSKGDQYTQEFGGLFPPHKCHQNGLEADFRYVRNDGFEIGLNLADSTQWQYFDEDATKALFRYLMTNANVDSIFVDTVHTSLGDLGDFIVHKSGHSDHFHVRIVDPDGTGN